MEVLLIYWLTGLLTYGDLAEDPAPVWSTALAHRAFECERLSQAEAHERYPARVPETKARTQVQIGIDALVCKRQVLSEARVREGSRGAREARILTELQRDLDEITALAKSAAPKAKRWHVDAFYPDTLMTQKIASATRVTLAERGVTVTSRAPLLAAGDVEVLFKVPMQEAMKSACARYFQSGAIDDSDAFLGVALLDARETQLHGGVCQKDARGDARWRWLR